MECSSGRRNPDSPDDLLLAIPQDKENSGSLIDSAEEIAILAISEVTELLTPESLIKLIQFI